MNQVVLEVISTVFFSKCFKLYPNDMSKFHGLHVLAQVILKKKFPSFFVHAARFPHCTCANVEYAIK